MKLPAVYERHWPLFFLPVYVLTALDGYLGFFGWPLLLIWLVMAALWYAGRLP